MYRLIRPTIQSEVIHCALFFYFAILITELSRSSAKCMLEKMSSFFTLISSIWKQFETNWKVWHRAMSWTERATVECLKRNDFERVGNRAETECHWEHIVSKEGNWGAEEAPRDVLMGGEHAVSNGEERVDVASSACELLWSFGSYCSSESVPNVCRSSILKRRLAWPTDIIFWFIKISSNKTTTGLERSALLAYPVLMVLLIINKKYKNRLIQSMYSLVTFFQLRLRSVKVWERQILVVSRFSTCLFHVSGIEWKTSDTSDMQYEGEGVEDAYFAPTYKHSFRWPEIELYSRILC